MGSGQRRDGPSKVNSSEFLQRNRANINLFTYRFIIRKWLLWLTRLTSPKIAVSKLETKECWWSSCSLEVGRPETQEKEGRKSMSQLKGSRAGGVPSHSGILFYSSLQLTGWGPPTLGTTHWKNAVNWHLHFLSKWYLVFTVTCLLSHQQFNPVHLGWG